MYEKNWRGNPSGPKALELFGDFMALYNLLNCLCTFLLVLPAALACRKKKQMNLVAALLLLLARTLSKVMMAKAFPLVP